MSLDSTQPSRRPTGVAKAPAISPSWLSLRGTSALAKNLRRFATYGATALIAVIVLGFSFRREPFILAGVYGDGGGDAAWFLGQFASIAQTGPFASNPHLNWPLGANTWAFPQAGVFILVVGWLIAVVTHVSALGTYQLTFAVVAVVNTVATLFLFRSINRLRFRQLSIVFSVAIGLSPFVLLKVVHLNVAAFFLVPIALGVVLRWPAITAQRDRVALLAVLFVAGALSPIWWAAVMLLILVASVPWMFALRSIHTRGMWWQPLLAIGLGVAIPTALGLIFEVPGAAKTRYAWDSNRFGGHFVDLLLASPYLNEKIPILAALKQGGSVELSMVGIVGGLLGILTVVLVMTLVSRRGLRQRSRMLLGLSLVTVLLFVLGGLGNLQAAMGVVVGEASPARVWARLVIVLALLGGTWAMHWFTSRRPLMPRANTWVRFSAYELSLVLIVALWSLDWVKAVPVMTSATPATQVAEARVVDFLTANLSPCPVAQLPVDSSPNEVMWIKEFGEVGYRGYVPYVLAPEFFWSYGGDATADTTVPTAKIGDNVTDATLTQLQTAGFCAVLFDGRMSALAVENGIPLPGLRLATTLTPTFQDSRYSLYILNPSSLK